MAAVGVNFWGGGVGVIIRGESIEQAVNNIPPNITSKQNIKGLNSALCLIVLGVFIFSFTIGL
jgi:hypothetical protein